MSSKARWSDDRYVVPRPVESSQPWVSVTREATKGRKVHHEPTVTANGTTPPDDHRSVSTEEPDLEDPMWESADLQVKDATENGGPESGTVGP